MIDARWHDEACVWLATSRAVEGLVIEAPTWPAMIEEARLVLPDLLALNRQGTDPVALTFRAEQHLELAGA